MHILIDFLALLNRCCWSIGGIFLLLILLTIRIDKSGENTYTIQWGLIPLIKRRKAKRQ